MTTDTQTWRQNRATHRWVTLNGEDYSCDICDTKTGSEPCPGEYQLVSQTEGEADQILATNRWSYEAEEPDDFSR